MQNDRDEERLRELRAHLYERGSDPVTRKRNDLPSSETEETPTDWQYPPQDRPVAPPPAPIIKKADSSKFSRRRRFRTMLVGGGAVFFALALILSITFLFFGRNTISNANIAINVESPFTVGGGEELSFEVTVENRNAVPIESATLIVEYPAGTQSADEDGKNLFRERKPLDRIGAGEQHSVPLRAVIFGEENEEKEIKISLEYRVAGSNATLYKNASPLKIKISSSPVSIAVDGVTQLSSGQEVVLELTVSSNSPTPLTDLLIEASYPFGFDFTSAEPQTSSGNNIWLISKLEPEEEQTIRVTGLLTGQTTEERIFTFTAGVASDRDNYALASVLTSATHEILLEQAFIDLSMRVNANENENAVIGARENASIEIIFTNTLSDTVHDVEIEASLSGNALDKSNVSASPGFYDSSSGTVTWDSRTNTQLREIAPGRSSSVSFSLTPRLIEGETRTPQVTITVNVKGRRVSENRVPEVLTETISRTVKVESVTTLSSYGLYSAGPFVNTGPIPPVAEEVTQYTLVFDVQNGSNSVTDAVVEATLPLYVTWLDLKNTSVGSLSYNSVSRTVTWQIGNLDAGNSQNAAFQVSVLPSASQVNTIPVLLSSTRMRATDRFTGTVIRSSSPDVSTQLMRDPDPASRDGRVRASGE